MSFILNGISGVSCNIDDVIVFGKTQKEHYKRSIEVLRKLEQAGITLNNKCEFFKSNLKYLGHMVSSDLDKLKF